MANSLTRTTPSLHGRGFFIPILPAPILIVRLQQLIPVLFTSLASIYKTEDVE